jgi:hypothetical protein
MMPLIFNSTIIVFFAVSVACGSAAVYADKRLGNMLMASVSMAPQKSSCGKALRKVRDAG